LDFLFLPARLRREAWFAGEYQAFSGSSSFLRDSPIKIIRLI